VKNGHGGFIVRTAAMNAAEEDLRADIRFLKVSGLRSRAGRTPEKGRRLSITI